MALSHDHARAALATIRLVNGAMPCHCQITTEAG